MITFQHILIVIDNEGLLMIINDKKVAKSKKKLLVVMQLKILYLLKKGQGIKKEVIEGLTSIDSHSTSSSSFSI